MPRTLTALYGSYADAEAARDHLIALGILSSDIDILDRSAYGDGILGEHKRGMMTGLKNLFGAHEDYHAYAEGLKRGKTLLSATVDDACADQAIQILEASHAVDFDQSQEDWRASGWPGARAGVYDEAGYAERGVDAPRAARAPDDVIQVAEERLVVGKREVERGGVRVRSYIVETPVSEQVALGEERVSVERRSVSRPPTAGDDTFRDPAVEIRKTGEETVLDEQAFFTDQLDFREVDQRTEEVRRTEVDVEEFGVSQVFTSVWDALEDSPAEAANMRLRSELMIAVQEAVGGWRLTQAQAAQRLDVTQPRLNDLLRGRVGKFSLDALALLAIRAGLNVHMQIEQAAA